MDDAVARRAIIADTSGGIAIVLGFESGLGRAASS
jgi:hypothetical protein